MTCYNLIEITTAFLLSVGIVLTNVDNAFVPQGAILRGTHSARGEVSSIVRDRMRWSCGIPTGIVSYKNTIYAAIGNRVVGMALDADGRLIRAREDMIVSGLIRSIVANESYIYVGMDNQSVIVLEQHDSEAPMRVIGELPMSSVIVSMVFVGPLLIVGTEEGVSIVSVERSAPAAVLNKVRIDDVVVGVWGIAERFVVGEETDTSGALAFFAIDDTNTAAQIARVVLPGVPVLVYATTDKFYAVDKSGHINIIDANSYLIIDVYDVGQKIVSAYAQSSKIILIGSGNITVWDIATQHPAPRLQLPWANERVSAVFVSDALALAAEGGHFAILRFTDSPSVVLGESICGRIDIVVAGRSRDIVGNQTAIWEILRSGGSQVSPLRNDGDGGCYDAIIVGDAIYCANGLNGLRIGAVPESGSVIWEERVPIAGGAWGVAVVNDRAYVTAGTRGLQVVDVQKASNATLLGEIPVQGYAQDVVIDNTMMYVATRFAGLQQLVMKSSTELDAINRLISDKTVLRLDLLNHVLAMALWQDGTAFYRDGVLSKVEGDTIGLDVQWENINTLWSSQQNGIAAAVDISAPEKEIDRVVAPSPIVRVSASADHVLFAAGSAGVTFLKRETRLFLPLSIGSHQAP